MQPMSLTSWRDNISYLEAWYDSEAGRQFLMQQNKLLEPKLATLFGYHLVQLSSCKKAHFFQSSKIKHCVKLAPVAEEKDVLIADEQLPFDHESVDVAIVHHVLECSNQPHTLLKELSRVVLPSGYLLIIGFNPYSLLGVKAYYQRLRKQKTWRNPLFSVQRLSDYLALLDFSVESISYGFYPFSQCQKKSRLFSLLSQRLERWQLPTGGFYVVLAKKQVSRLTPLRFQKVARAGRMRLLNPALYQHPQNKEVSSCQNKK